MQKCRGKGKLGLDVKGQAGGERGGSRTRCREDWVGKKERVGACAIVKQKWQLSGTRTRGKQPLHCTACIAAGLLICKVKRNIDLQNPCTEMFQWRKGKATSSSSVYCELQAEQLLSDVGSLSKAGINLPSYLSLVAFSPCGACC